MREFCFVENDIELFGNRFAPVHTVGDLGVMLDSKMTMSQHVSRVCQNCYFQIRLIRRLGKALSVESKFLLVHALVHSRLDYCDSVLARLPWSLVSYSLCWILLLVWFLAWSALITLHLPWWICIGFHTRSASHKNCVWSCLSACMVLSLLILLTIALVRLWCLVDRLWDLLLMVTLLFLVIGLTGVWDLLRWLAPAVGMLCLLVRGLPLLV